MPQALPSMHKILIRGVNWLGDAVMTTPALLRIREAHPDAHIAILTADKLADLWLEHPAINEVIPFSKVDGVGAIAKKLTPLKFDIALVFPNSFRSAFEVWLAGIPRRIGYRGGGRSMLLTDAITRPRRPAMRKRTPLEIKRLISRNPDKPRDTYPAEAHHIHDYLNLGATIGASPQITPPLLKVSPGERSQFLEKWKIGGVQATRVIGINPGAEYGPAKRWPVARFVAALQLLAKSYALEVIVFGGRADQVLAGQIESSLSASAIPVLNLAGKTSLRELAIGLSQCELLLTNDTGPMHLASALGVPVVVPFGSTSPELTGPGLPYSSEHALIKGAAPCAPCFLRECPIDFRCMTSIHADAVADAAAKLLAAG